MINEMHKEHSNVVDDFREWTLLIDTPSNETIAASCLSGDFFMHYENDNSLHSLRAGSGTIQSLRELIKELEQQQFIMSTDFDGGGYNPAVAWRMWDERSDGRRRPDNQSKWLKELARLQGEENG